MKDKLIIVTRILTGVALVLANTLSTADTSAPLVADRPAGQAEWWLQLQREGNAASRHVQAVTPAERELSMQRLLDSYAHPIPEYFGEDDGGSFER